MMDNDNIEPTEQKVEEQNQAEGAPVQEAAETGEARPAADQEIENLKNELQEARTRSNEYLDGWQRSRAEFSNYRKRVEREQAQAYQNASGTIIKRYLEILDDLERALKNRPTSGDGAQWAEGIELIYRKLLSYLEAEGVKQMNVEGQTFDPNLHEAISQEESYHHESGQVIEELKKGYMLGDKVLRPALVRIAR